MVVFHAPLGQRRMMSSGCISTAPQLCYGEWCWNWRTVLVCVEMGGPTYCRSAAESAPQKHCQKPNDLAREAVGWNGVLARCEFAWYCSNTPLSPCLLC